MKMTGLEWRYLQRIALDHPYYDTHKPPLSEAEARAIMEENNVMTGREFVDSIYFKLGKTRPEEKRDRFAWLRSIGELFSVPPIRRIAIIAFVVIILTVFFTATPVGRAIADSIIRYFTRIDDDRLIVERNDHDATWTFIHDQGEAIGGEQQVSESDYVYLCAFDDFASVTGKTPFELPLRYKELFYEYDDVIGYLTLYAVYDVPDGKVVTYQIWGTEDLSCTTLTGFRAYDANETIFYSLEEEGEIIIYRIYEDTIFHVSSKGYYTLDELISMLADESNKASVL